MYAVVLLALTTSSEAPNCHRGGCAPCYPCVPYVPCYPCVPMPSYAPMPCYRPAYVTPHGTNGKRDDHMDKKDDSQKKKMDPEKNDKLDKEDPKKKPDPDKNGKLDKEDAAKKKPDPDKMDKEEMLDPDKVSVRHQSARIVVSLPANAKLTVDDVATKKEGTKRQFLSPPLPPGFTGAYTLKAEFTRNGKTVTETRTVIVTAGKEIQVSFDETPQKYTVSR